VGLGLTGAVSAQSYNCQFSRAGGMLPPQVRITMTGDQTAQVLDGLIQQVYGGPIEGRVTSNSAKRLTVKWEVQLNKRIFYTVSIYKPGLNADFKLNNPSNFEFQINEYGPEFAGSKGQCRQG